jgi:hypothetical protein
MKNVLLKPIFSKALALLIVAVVIFSACKKDDDEPQVTSVEIVSMSPESPANLKYYQTATNDRVNITFNYNVTEPDGARIFIKGVAGSGGQATLKYSPSPVYTGTGSKTVLITVTSDQPSFLIDQIQIIIKNPDQSETISEMFQDVNYTFSN